MPSKSKSVNKSDSYGFDELTRVNFWFVHCLGLGPHPLGNTYHGYERNGSVGRTQSLE